MTIRLTALAGASLGALAASMLIAAGAAAQTAPASAPGASSLDEVIVTARKREENVLNVPIAITNYSEQELARAGATSLADLAALTPGLTFQDVNGAYAAPTIRGVVQVDQTSLQGNVGVFIDGVYLNNRSGLEFGLLDIARIEIDKGPQAALYGRNTFAGAINYVTAQPVLGRFTGRLSGEVGTYGRRTLQGSVSIPLGETFAVRVFGGHSDFDGTIKNNRSGNYIGGYRDNQAYGISALFQPTDKFSIKAFYTHGEVNNLAEPLVQQPTILNNCGSTTIRGGVTYRTLFCGGTATYTSVNVDDKVGYGTTGENELSYVTAEYEMPFATLTGTLSYNEANYANLIDTVSNPNAINVAGPFGSTQTFVSAVSPISSDTTLDVRLSSLADSPIEWTVGFYGYDSDLSNITQVSAQPLRAPTAQPVPFSVNGGRLRAEGRAVYGSLGYKFTDKLTATAEVRYTQEDQEFNGTGSLAIVGGRPNTGTQDFDFWTPRFTASYAFTPEIVGYASAARGVKTGSFNANAFGPAPAFYKYGIESNWSYELGIKTTNLLDGKLKLNADVFYVDWSGIQGQRNVPGSILSVVLNQGDARSRGVEADATYFFTPNISVHVSGAYQDPKYKSGFIDGDLAAPCGDFPGTQIAVIGCSDLVAGNQMGRTSKYQFAVAPNLEFPQLFMGMDAFVRADFSYQSGKYTTGGGQNDQGAIKLINGRIGVTRGGFEFALWGKNLADYHYAERVTIAASTNDGAPTSGITLLRIYPAERRTFGARLDYRF